MAKFAVLFVAALAFTATLAAPKKNQGGGGAQKNQIEEIGAQLETIANDFTATVQNIMPDNKQLLKTVDDKTKEFTNDLDNILNKIKAELEKNKGVADNALKQTAAKLTENIQALQQLAGPDASAKAQEYKTQLEATFKNAVTEFENFGKSVQPNLQHAGDSITTFAKGIMDDFLKSAQNLQTQVNNAIQGQKQKPK